MLAPLQVSTWSWAYWQPNLCRPLDMICEFPRHLVELEQWLFHHVAVFSRLIANISGKATKHKVRESKRRMPCMTGSSLKYFHLVYQKCYCFKNSWAKPDIAVMAFVFGWVWSDELNILIRANSKVTSRAIRPGTISTGIRKLIQDKQTNNPDGK